ncbi:MAG: hypothetical protein U1E69_01745 [Tabrizicola sp.]|uniref:hypothetical protein n=1 Tax=Tabrizicola sp. TaxID=2005166 RepID=UPI002AB8E385|nr:hypothetical protein [Tabrizicola sp.]MDZ4085501.1 hypothetical protein [Tabrizicola sp.]
MRKGKSDGKKKKKKSSQLVIRIEEGERDAFAKLCDKLDTTAAREIRRFMREWVAQHSPVAEAAAPIDAAAETDATDAVPTAEPLAEAPAKPARRKRKPTSAPAA